MDDSDAEVAVIGDTVVLNERLESVPGLVEVEDSVPGTRGAVEADTENDEDKEELLLKPEELEVSG